MKKYKVPFIKPDFPSADDVASDYAEILKANWFTNFGPFERRFSKQIASYVGEGYFACTFSNATLALMGSILAVLGKGDGTKYILMPSFTFAAGVDALVWCGYKPLLIDIEGSGLHMAIGMAKTALEDTNYSNDIVGILFCNAFGVGTTNIDEWEKLADDHKKPLIIDSAAGFGSLYSENRKVGSAGRCEIFSFHATKPFAIGEGGAVVSRDAELIQSLMSIQNFGFIEKNKVNQLGFNGKLQEISAAIGLRQFDRFEDKLDDRRKTFEHYKTQLNPRRFITQKNAHNASLCFATVLVKQPQDRDKYLRALHTSGVGAETYYNPSIHKQEGFKQIERYGDLKVTDLVDNSVLSLPIHDNMLEKDIKLVVQTLNEA